MSEKIDRTMIFRQPLIDKIKFKIKIKRERLKLEKSKDCLEGYSMCIWLEGQIFALESILMEL